MTFAPPKAPTTGNARAFEPRRQRGAVKPGQPTSASLIGTLTFSTVLKGPEASQSGPEDSQAVLTTRYAVQHGWRGRARAHAQEQAGMGSQDHVHLKSEFYDVASFKQGRNSLRPIER